MNVLHRNLRIAILWALVFVLLTLVACGTASKTVSTPGAEMLFATPGVTSGQTTLALAPTQENIKIGDQQMAFNSVNLMQSATLNQNAIRQTPMAVLAKIGAESALNQQNKDELAADAQTAVATYTATPTQKPTNIPIVGEMAKDHIVFYLIQPEKGRQDACGNIQLVPIISKRMRSGDKLRDVQVALQMLFDLKRKIYIQWYNALWDTDLTIDKHQYIAQKDYMIIDFGGYLPAGQLSNCDKHGIREQIWTTFFHYGIKEKTFKINGVFLIDQLNRNTK